LLTEKYIQHKRLIPSAVYSDHILNLPIGVEIDKYEFVAP